jgi:hypothetical protein
MARRQLLTEGERRQLFGVPADPDALVRHYTLSRSDLDLVATRRGDANRLGFAVQLALLRHQGLALAQAEGEIGTLVYWMAGRIDIPVGTFADYARRPQTMTDHARDLAAALELRPATDTDLPFMIEAAARAAWTTDKGLPIAAGIVAALRSKRIILPVAAVNERAGAAGRARARQRVAEALLAGLTDEQLRALDELLVIDPKTGFTRLAWVKEIPSLPKAGHIRDLLDKLHVVRGLGIDPDTAARIPENRFQQFAREGSTSFAHRTMPKAIASRPWRWLLCPVS